MNRLSLAAIASLGVVLLTSVACSGDEEEAAVPADGTAPAAAPAEGAAPAVEGAAPAAPAGPKPWLDDSPNPEWTCAAFCLGTYTCSVDGPSKWDKTFRTSVGRTAAEAFTNLYNKCEADGASDIVQGFHCIGGQPLYDWAPMADVCARTR
jgi:hypothetical protein